MDALVRLYPRSWRHRHEAEFRDALAVTVDPSGRLPFREVRSAFTGGLRERARGESTTPGELVLSALGDGIIFSSGVVAGIAALATLGGALPDVLLVQVAGSIAGLLFVSSMLSLATFRAVASVSGPLLWIVDALNREGGRSGSRSLFAPGALPFAVIGMLAFVGLALLLRRRVWAGLLVFAPAVLLAARGASMGRNANYLDTGAPRFEVRMAWAFGFLLLCLVWTAAAVTATGRLDQPRVRPLHLAALIVGALAWRSPGVVVALLAGAAIALAWWNPRPAVVALTWPTAMSVANTAPLAVLPTNVSSGPQWRLLLPAVGALLLALFLRYSAGRVHRLS